MAHILLIKDNDPYWEMLHFSLQDKEQTVVSTLDVQKEVKAYGKAKFDLVITDMLMPNKGGATFIEGLVLLRNQWFLYCSFADTFFGVVTAPAGEAQTQAIQ